MDGSTGSMQLIEASRSASQRCILAATTIGGDIDDNALGAINNLSVADLPRSTDNYR